MVYVVLLKKYVLSDDRNSVTFEDVNVIGIFRDAKKVVEFVRGIAGWRGVIYADELPPLGECEDLERGTLTICNAFSDL